MKKIYIVILILLILMGIGYYLTFVKHIGFFHNALMVEISKEKLNSILKEVELHKIKYNEYPESLQEIRESLEKELGKFSFPLYDPILINCSEEPVEFFYKKLDKGHYYLLGVGCDMKPFTEDDLLPDIETHNFGLVIHES
ncbi:hypothetical protein [Sulfuricurvum sp.]|uniref:hypothetical protein n=1 Tax=Sulfuricurvum sp. TaxID=2025608 RepID=UPI00263982F7|nr:hypothetical protein [Sulfuricurvum sp.]MDD4884561.1 hypothetical protein [Sulfuricurvum sp.]